MAKVSELENNDSTAAGRRWAEDGRMASFGCNDASARDADERRRKTHGCPSGYRQRFRCYPMKKPAGGGLRTKRQLGGLLGSALKRELRGIIFFPRLFEGDVG